MNESKDPQKSKQPADNKEQPLVNQGLIWAFVVFALINVLTQALFPQKVGDQKTIINADGSKANTNTNEVRSLAENPTPLGSGPLNYENSASATMDSNRASVAGMERAASQSLTGSMSAQDAFRYQEHQENLGSLNSPLTSTLGSSVGIGNLGDGLLDRATVSGDSQERDVRARPTERPSRYDRIDSNRQTRSSGSEDLSKATGGFPVSGRLAY